VRYGQRPAQRATLVHPCSTIGACEHEAATGMFVGMDVAGVREQWFQLEFIKWSGNPSKRIEHVLTH
jgi:hypothetical protein